MLAVIKRLPRISTYRTCSWEGHTLSKLLITAFESNASCAGTERRFTGPALSATSSMKSLTIKSLFEMFSSVKLGPVGNKVLAPPVLPFNDAIDNSRELPRPQHYIETCNNPEPSSIRKFASICAYSFVWDVVNFSLNFPGDASGKSQPRTIRGPFSSAFQQSNSKTHKPPSSSQQHHNSSLLNSATLAA